MNAAVLIITILTSGSQSGVASSVDRWKLLRNFEPPASASSKKQLIGAFESIKAHFTVKETRCRGGDYLFFTLDKGSGMYLIHGYLYKTKAGHPVEILRIYPRTNASRLTMQVKDNKFTFIAAMPKMTFERVADYMVNEEG